MNTNVVGKNNFLFIEYFMLIVLLLRKIWKQHLFRNNEVINEIIKYIK